MTTLGTGCNEENDTPNSSAAKPHSLLTLLRLRWWRLRGGWRCAVRVHRWRGHDDCGDGVNVMPISGYRKPRSIHSWRVCTWCGAHAIAARTDGMSLNLTWGRANRG